jgi:hypothetical protein
MGFQSTQISSGNILKGEKILIPRRVLIIVHEARGVLKNTLKVGMTKRGF